MSRLVEVRNIWKAYSPDAFAVRDVSFTLSPGEFLTLLGPSGSGKTSTLMMVAGFETPTRGEIRVDGRDVARLPPEARNFGVVFQGYALFPHMTVQQNVEFPMRMRGSRDRAHTARLMLDRVGLAGLARRKPRELSGGQQQRVALARALVFEPDALLLDEPLGALDRKMRDQLQTEIKDIQRRVGISILYVTHDQDEAMTMSDRIAVMTGGEIVQIGAPADVYLHPDTEFVAGFLGETNLLPVEVLGTSDGQAAVRYRDGATGSVRLPLGALPDETALVSIRPERIRILRDTDQAGQTASGTLTGHRFLGRYARCAVRALGQDLVVATPDPHPPGLVRLGWDWNDAQLLARDKTKKGIST